LEPIKLSPCALSLIALIWFISHIRQISYFTQCLHLHSVTVTLQGAPHRMFPVRGLFHFTAHYNKLQVHSVMPCAYCQGKLNILSLIIRNLFLKWGMTLTAHSLLVPCSRKGRAIPLLPLRAVRPVQSLSASTRVLSFLKH